MPAIFIYSKPLLLQKQFRSAIPVEESSMKKTVVLHDKEVRVELSDAAEAQVKNLSEPLVVEVHLIMGCMVVKRVWFKPPSEIETLPLLDPLRICFRVVKYDKKCRISHIDSGDEEPTDFPIVADKKAFVPNWLKIDFHGGKWAGEYGYDPKGSSLFF